MRGMCPCPARIANAFFHLSQSIKNVSELSFFYDEGPRSRRYRRTAALRLIVQPCDEDD
jgi:hypothetical protein